MPEPISTTSGFGVGLVMAAAAGVTAVAAVASALIWSASGVGAAPDAARVDAAAVDDPGVGSVAAEQDALAAALMRAPIPDGTCEQPGGDLVDGVLPTPGAEGIVWLPGVTPDRTGPEPVNSGAPVDASAADGRVAYGDVTGDGVTDVVAILECDAGGVEWPANLFVFEQAEGGDLRVVGAVNLGDVSDIGRSWFEEVVVDDGSLLVRWTGNRATANAGPPDTAFEVTAGFGADGLDLSGLTERGIG